MRAWWVAACVGWGCASGQPSSTATPPMDGAAIGVDGGTTADFSIGVDTSVGVDAAPWQPGAHPPLPQVQSGGGAVVAQPHVITLSFDGDPHATKLAPLLSALATQPYWSEVTAEYGVGPLTVGEHH